MSKDKTMKCADCLHYEACQSWVRHGTALWDDFHYSVEDCPFYEDKSAWVHLPCKVGDAVYCFAPCFGTDHNPKLKVVEKEIVELKTIATVFGLNFDIDSIGKTIFLTREEAEKALAERKEK